LIRNYVWREGNAGVLYLDTLPTTLLLHVFLAIGHYSALDFLCSTIYFEVIQDLYCYNHESETTAEDAMRMKKEIYANANDVYSAPHLEE
jgi:hypothetical protein